MTDTEQVIKLLEKHDRKLEKIFGKIETIAVQQAEIRNLREQADEIEQRLNTLTEPGGKIYDMGQWQAGCPRTRIWWILGLMGSIQAAIITTLLKMKG